MDITAVRGPVLHQEARAGQGQSPPKLVRAEVAGHGHGVDPQLGQRERQLEVLDPARHPDRGAVAGLHAQLGGEGV
ncbi:MAG: hypothetical protein WKF33_11415, partial [Thermoleophilaceae bacterium]